MLLYLIWPSDLSSSPLKIDRTVDFPHPLGPTIDTNSPSYKSKEKSYNIQVDLIEKASKKWVVDNTDELLKKDPYHLNNIYHFAQALS